jgi:hypothetical protein
MNQTLAVAKIDTITWQLEKLRKHPFVGRWSADVAGNRCQVDHRQRDATVSRNAC